jgi:hypothetical protein
MTRGARAGRWLKESLVHNLPLKLVSIVFSLSFYAFLHGAQNAQRTFPVSVVTLLPPDDASRALLTQPPATVRVTLSGGRTILDELKAEDLGTVQLDVRKGAGSFASFDTSRLKIPAGLTPTVDPPGIDLVWDSIVTRPVPIQISVTGQPAPGFAVQGEPTADPKVSFARGPLSIVETIQHARAEPFDVGGLAEGVYTRKITIDAPPSRVAFLEQSTMVTVQIGRARLDRVYVRLAVQVIGPARATVVPPEVDVRVSGPLDVVDSLRPEQLVPVADARAIAADGKPGSATVPVSVSVEGCTTQVTPATVVVKW